MRVLLLLLCLLPPALRSQTPVAYRIETIAAGLEFPWSLAFLPDGRVLVTEQVGRLRLIENGGLRDVAITGVPVVYAAGQAGLLEVLADPDFNRNQTLYLSLAHGDADANRLRVVRARLAEAALSDVQVVFEAHPAKRGDAHFGGRMAWLPDRTLVIGVGDGFVHREEAQRLDNHFGKFVRIGRDGSIPRDNPFVGETRAREEIYSRGHRNPQAVLFDPVHGALFAHEHGPRGGDELNRLVSGGNFGWPLATHGLDYTGARVSPWQNYPDTIAPLLTWTPSIAPAGMTRYDGDRFPAWRGSYFIAALAEKSVRRVPMQDAKPGIEERLFTELGERVRDVRSAPDGTLWLLTDSAQGRVLRVVPAEP